MNTAFTACSSDPVVSADRFWPPQQRFERGVGRDLRVDRLPVDRQRDVARLAARVAAATGAHAARGDRQAADSGSANAQAATCDLSLPLAQIKSRSRRDRAIGRPQLAFFVDETEVALRAHASSDRS